MSLIWFLPESLRWLFANGKSSQAHEVLTKYHGNGNGESAIVQLECNEIQDSINYEAEMTSDKALVGLPTALQLGPDAVPDHAGDASDDVFEIHRRRRHQQQLLTCRPS
jgi:hypothetical protein